ncbi:hypothetical protein ASZ90_019817 [hydrocarbon metagenome]|uniref:Uncharacterized protein n=1 Tax=hydrocarbon metagenome TaxID=938273 RepID=A0A0W8E2B4_9ZZZZ
MKTLLYEDCGQVFDLFPGYPGKSALVLISLGLLSRCYRTAS